MSQRRINDITVVDLNNKEHLFFYSFIHELLIKETELGNIQWRKALPNFYCCSFLGRAIGLDSEHGSIMMSYENHHVEFCYSTLNIPENEEKLKVYELRRAIYKQLQENHDVCNPGIPEMVSS